MRSLQARQRNHLLKRLEDVYTRIEAAQSVARDYGRDEVANRLSDAANAAMAALNTFKGE